MEDYLATCKELGKEPEKTYKGSFNVRIPSEPLNDFVKHAVDYVLSRPPD